MDIVGRGVEKYQVSYEWTLLLMITRDINSQLLILAYTFITKSQNMCEQANYYCGQSYFCKDLETMWNDSGWSI